jgi:hypothetical protein
MPREKSFWLYSKTFQVWKTSKVREKEGQLWRLARQPENLQVRLQKVR